MRQRGGSTIIAWTGRTASLHLSDMVAIEVELCLKHVVLAKRTMVEQ